MGKITLPSEAGPIPAEILIFFIGFCLPIFLMGIIKKRIFLLFPKQVDSGKDAVIGGVVGCGLMLFIGALLVLEYIQKASSTNEILIALFIFIVGLLIGLIYHKAIETFFINSR